MNASMAERAECCQVDEGSCVELLGVSEQGWPL